MNIKKHRFENLRATYDPTDLLNINKKHVSLNDRLWSAFQDCYNAFVFKSSVIEKYFCEVSLQHTKRYFRTSLKFIVFYFWTHLLFSIQFDPNLLSMTISTAILVVMILVLYLLTLSPHANGIYQQLSVCVIMIFLGYNIFNVDLVLTNFEYFYTPGAQFIIIMYVILPLKLQLCLCIGSLYSLIFVYYSKFKYLNCETLFKTVEKHRFLFYTRRNMNCTQSREIRLDYIYSQTVLWISLHCVGIYLHLSNQLRRRTSYLRLGENVKSQNRSKDALKAQMRCIDAIMPSEIKNGYLEERDRRKLDDLWVYSQTFDNVTILFADIIGFTKLSSNKTAQQVVTLLNDLFYRFDQMCDYTHCEKLGTLGDCYYCVAGCPVPRTDHAVCCVQMGRGMCMIIQTFNKDHNEDVNMRVGVHSGRVNAAIIGNQRFRFDVYSNDVLIANEIEATGKAGLVHISHETYTKIKLIYSVINAPDLEVKREKKSGIAGLVIHVEHMKTYFVISENDDQRTQLLSDAAAATSSGKRTLQMIAGSPGSTCLSSSGMDKSDQSQFSSLHSSMAKKRDDIDLLFIDALRNDCDHQIKLFNQPPIWYFSLNFKDPEVEQHYIEHARTEAMAVSIDSVKFAPFLDCLACLLFNIMFLGAAILMLGSNLLSTILICLSFSVSILFTIITGWVMSKSVPMITSKNMRTLFLILSHLRIKQLMVIYLCSMPYITILVLVNDVTHMQIDKLNAFVSLHMFANLGNIAFISISYLIKLIPTIIFNTIFLVMMFFNYRTNSELDSTTSKPLVCQSYLFYDDELPYFINFVTQIALFLYVIVIVSRENETNMRLSFFVCREVQIRLDEAVKTMNDSRDMLHNIIPEYVLETILACGGDIVEGNFSYAVTVPDIGVAFACISNFFSTYYREDYKGGEGALRLLNKIICMFDNLLLDSKYHDVEKIKTIKDCYMVASGLNVKQVKVSPDSHHHLRAILKYCFDLQEQLKLFNTEYVFGADTFEMKIGFNIGPVTAGIIGTTKPMYDIWGDTVNVASRMYTTADKNTIHVTSVVAKDLNKYFTFINKGSMMIKGKGSMETFNCINIKEKIKNNLHDPEENYVL